MEDVYRHACEVIPGGVSSPVRAFGSVGGTPVFLKAASGAHVVDIEDRRYVDLVCSWGPALLGHAHPEVVTAVQEAATRGLSFGAPTTPLRGTPPGNVTGTASSRRAAYGPVRDHRSGARRRMTAHEP